MRKKEDEFKKLEEEMVEKGSMVKPIEREAPPTVEQIEEALRRREEETLREEDPKFVSPEEEEAFRKKKKKIVRIVVLVTILLVLGVGAFFAWKLLGPSTKKADITKEFNIGKDEVALIIDGQISEKKGRVINGETYIPSDIAGAYMDNRIYVDTKEKILSYATEEGVTDYALDEEKDGEKPLAEADGTLYVALGFIAKNAICEYKEYKDPNRITIFYDRAKTYSVGTLGREERVRKGPGNKYPYIMDMEEGEEFFIDPETKAENEYQPIVTKDGIKGYIMTESIRKTESKTMEFSKEPTSFTQKTIDGKVCLGWHNIGSENYTDLPMNVSVATTLNVIAPTWFVVSDNKGNVSSIANKQYVDEAHAAGLQVWPTLKDFPSKGIKHTKVLGYTKYRRKLIKNVIALATELGVEGINVDFEQVPAKGAGGYLEFLRELVIEGHKNNLIISSDNYPIREYNSYYNPQEQGRVVDYVIFMAYDEHYSGSEQAGSVSSILYVQDAVAKGIQRVDKDRVVIGLPFFTRLWLETETNDGVELTSEVMNMSEAENWVYSRNLKPKWDKEVGQNYVECKEGKKKTYKLWMENEKSLKLKLKEVKNQDIAGAAFWAMGGERAVTWETIAKSFK